MQHACPLGVCCLKRTFVQVDTTPELDLADIVLDVSQPIGRGGFAVVYRGTLRGKPVAVKSLFTGGAATPDQAAVPSDVKKRMKREATIMCSLNHPNVLCVMGVVPDRGWIVMELCTGGTLKVRPTRPTIAVCAVPDTHAMWQELLLDEELLLEEADLFRLAAETATGIAYLHMTDVAIVHGDLKAANVLLTAERCVRICDFGMSEAKDRSKSLTSAALSTNSSGGLTVAWTAPEVLKGEPKTYASDVFALGVTLWEIFMRATPFKGMPEMVRLSVPKRARSGVH